MTQKPYVKIYFTEDLERLKKISQDIIKILPSDFEEAIDILTLTVDCLFENKEDFIIRFRNFKVLREKE